jgi:nucleotide-binding universal stress UspA family protein
MHHFLTYLGSISKTNKLLEGPRTNLRQGGSMNNKMRILIAYDGSNCADDALCDLGRAGLPPFAEALIVNVAEVWLPLPLSHQSEIAIAVGTNSVEAQRPDLQPDQPSQLDEISLRAADAAERLKSFFPEWTVKAESLRGSPAAAVVRKAAEWNANLLVAGARGKGESSRSWLGSVSQKLANEAPCSVRIARSHGAWKKGAPVRILIGLDGSSSAEAAVAEVARRFWIIGTEVRIVVVLDKPTPTAVPEIIRDMDDPSSTGKSGHPSWVSGFVDRARSKLSQAELHVSEFIDEGDPKQIIVAEAEEWGADCIFIGAGDDGESARSFLLGSVSTAVVARAHCTVEIVRNDTRDYEDARSV